MVVKVKIKSETTFSKKNDVGHSYHRIMCKKILQIFERLEDGPQNWVYGTDE